MNFRMEVRFEGVTRKWNSEGSMDSRGCERILPIKAHEAKLVPNSLSVQPCRFSVMTDRSTGMQDSDGNSSECSVAVTATVSGTGSRSES